MVTATLPGLTATEAPVPGTEAATPGSAEGMIGSGGIGSSTPAEGIWLDVPIEAVAPAAVAFRPAADAVTVALPGRVLRVALPPTRA